VSNDNKTDTYLGGQPLPSTTLPEDRALDLWWHATYWPQIEALLEFIDWANGYDDSFVIEANVELRNDE
jgi:hypothetical protein